MDRVGRGGTDGRGRAQVTPTHAIAVRGRMNLCSTHWAFQGPQAHRRHVTQKSAGGEEVLTAVEFVPGSSDVTNNV